jgi:hypothetical protein
MDISDFRATLAEPQPPEGLAFALQAMWWDAKGNWDQAHECAQAKEDMPGNWVHAYLHRKEGDLANAGYWYRRAGQPVATTSLAEEWAQIVTTLLADS